MTHTDLKSQVGGDDVSDLLSSMREKGVRIWADNGRLCYKAPKGSLNHGDLEKLRARKARIVDFLKQSGSTVAGELVLTPRLRSDEVPLTFSQEAYWHLLRKANNLSIRTVSTAIRVYGPLNVAALRQCFFALVVRHESLRTTIVPMGEGARQSVGEADKLDLETLDLRHLPEATRDAEARRFVENRFNEPIDVTVGPLFAAYLVALRHHDHVLAITTDPLISDGVSLGIVLRDLWTMYSQSERGVRSSLPELPVQFPDYAVWQRRTQRVWADKHGAYWRDRLAGAHRLYLPHNVGSDRAARFKTAGLPIRFGKTISAGLRELSQRERVPLVMTVLTAYVALLLRWCSKRDLVVPFITTGRSLVEIENCVGSFVSTLYLRVKSFERDSFLDLLKRVTEEYCMAYEHGGQMPSSEFMLNPVFDWLPPQAELSSSASILDSGDRALCDSLSFEPFPFTSFPFANVATPFDYVECSYEPAIILWDTADEILGHVIYQADRFAPIEMERFTKGLVQISNNFSKEPGARVAAILCEP